MIRYKTFDASQGLFLTVNLEEQLVPGSFEHTLNYLIDQLDLSAFDAAFHNDEKGAPAYPPAVMLKIIFYCYSRGIITSRPMEYACKTNITVKALAQDAEPDHATIAHFISSQAEAVKDQLNGAMQELSGKAKPLKKAIVESDTGYFSENNLREAAERGVEVIIPDPQFRKRDEQFAGQRGRGGKGRFTAKDFKYDKKRNQYLCPRKKVLEYKGHVELNRNSGEKYQAKSGDCRGCKLQEKCIASRGGKDPKRTLYIVDKKKEENLSEKMRKKIDEVKYRVLYGRRMQIREPCIADINYCKKMHRFTLRTKAKVNIQWLLYCIVHNIGKCMPKTAVAIGG
jgi:transposase